jgi:hypothetical protein
MHARIDYSANDLNKPSVVVSYGVDTHGISWQNAIAVAPPTQDFNEANQ